jgi:predicted TIM-barrel fold metal-dependent hydrolase
MHRFISVDDHVQEPPELWTSRLGARWAERVPHLAEQQGRHYWMADGKVLNGGALARSGAAMADRNADSTQWDDVPSAAYSPLDRLKAMDAGGIGFSALFPSVAGLAGEAFASLDDPGLELACVQVYNDWLVEEWGTASPRFIPQCIVPISSPRETAAEIRRAVAKGHRGVVFPALPMDLSTVPHVADPDYDEVWATCAELGVPLCLHAGASPTLQYPPGPHLSSVRAAALDDVTRGVSSVYVLGLYLFSRILIRHPDLRIIMAESGLSWGTLYLEWADHQFEHDGLHREGYELTPSEMFHRQVYLDGWFDHVDRFAPYLGIDRLLWSANFPLANSSWPRTQETIERCFTGVGDADRDRVLWSNAAELYGVSDE